MAGLICGGETNFLRALVESIQRRRIYGLSNLSTAVKTIYIRSHSQVLRVRTSK